MHPADIKARLEKKGITQAALARELGVSGATIHKVIKNEAVSDRVMRAIAAKINMDHRKLFARYYEKKAQQSPQNVNQDQCQI